MSESLDTSVPGAVNVACPHCESIHPVREQVLGRMARCTGCGQRFVLRRPEAAAEELSALAIGASDLPPPTFESDGPPNSDPPTAFRDDPPHAPSPASPPPPAPQLDPPPPLAPASRPTPPEFELPVSPLPSATPPSAPPAPATLAPAERRKLPMSVRILAFAAVGFEAFAAVAFVGALLGTIGALVGAVVQGGQPGGSFVYLVVAGYSFLWGGVVAIALLLAAQAIRVALLVEDHTYQAQNACRVMAAESQAPHVHQPPDGPSGAATTLTNVTQ